MSTDARTRAPAPRPATAQYRRSGAVMHYQIPTRRPCIRDVVLHDLAHARINRNHAAGVRRDPRDSRNGARQHDRLSIWRTFGRTRRNGHRAAKEVAGAPDPGDPR
jgi:hypothetical protein